MEKIIEFTECRYCPHVYVLITGKGHCIEQGYKVIALDRIDEDCTLEDAPVKYEKRHIEEIKKIAIKLRKELSDQPLSIRRKISSIANLAEICLTNESSEGDNL